MTNRTRRLLLIADAIFLGVMSVFGLAADMASYFSGAGPFGSTFLADPRVIGVVEAHGLALLIAIAGGIAAARDGFAPGWHLLFATVHILLGGANIAFFAIFVLVGVQPMGIIVTALHGFFAIAQLGAFAGRHRAG